MGRWSCAVPMCSNFRKKDNKSLSWHVFPKNEALRKQWVIKIRRDIGPNFTINKNTRVCSQHFVETDFRKMLHGKHLKLLKTNSVPSVFQWTDQSQFAVAEERSRRRTVRNKRKTLAAPKPNLVEQIKLTSEVESPNMETHEAISTKDHEKECHNLRRQLEELETRYRQEKELNNQCFEDKILKLTRDKDLLNGQLLHYCNIKTNNKLVNFYTGLPDAKTFQGLLHYFEPKIKKCVFWKSTIIGKPDLECKLDYESSFFLVLLRLKLNTPVVDLSRIFAISSTIVSRIFITWITLMFHEFKQMFAIPPLRVIKASLPPQFKQYPDTTIIIDCTEIRVQMSSELNSHKETFSNDKRMNTIKALIGITPGGLVCFVSCLYGGLASDKEIVRDSGFLKLMSPGHCIMADKGFEIESLLPQGVKLNVLPKFMKRGRIQMCEPGVFSVTRRIAKVRVHVERVIQRIKTFHILDHVLPLSMRDISEQIVAVCAFLTNFKPGLSKAKRNNEPET